MKTYKKNKCKHNMAYDEEKFWCIKCGYTEFRETPTTKNKNYKPTPII